VKAAAAHLPVSPSRILVRFADEIASFGSRLVVDAPCGFGRNAIALAARGCAVVAIDNDYRRLATLERAKADYIGDQTTADVRTGRIFTVCADLIAGRWPVAPSSVSAIICVHFVMMDLIPDFISALEVGGYLYVETFGGQGMNFLALPKAGQLRELLSRHMEFRYYKERKVGPTDIDSVAVTLLAQRRREHADRPPNVG
jgi:SAM-dependent methyltransferase